MKFRKLTVCNFVVLVVWSIKKRASGRPPESITDRGRHHSTGPRDQQQRQDDVVSLCQRRIPQRCDCEVWREAEAVGDDQHAGHAATDGDMRADGTPRSTCKRLLENGLVVFKIEIVSKDFFQM